METVKMWVMGISFSAIISAVVLALSPSGAAEKSIKTIVSVFLISSMLLPLVKGEKINVDFDLSDISQVENNGFDNTFSSAFKENLKTEIKNTLEKYDIKPREINIDINMDNGEITVNKIQIFLKKENVDKADDILQNQLDLVAEIKGE